MSSSFDLTDPCLDLIASDKFVSTVLSDALWGAKEYIDLLDSSSNQLSTKVLAKLANKIKDLQFIKDELDMLASTNSGLGENEIANLKQLSNNIEQLSKLHNIKCASLFNKLF